MVYTFPAIEEEIANILAAYHGTADRKMACLRAHHVMIGARGRIMEDARVRYPSANDDDLHCGITEQIMAAMPEDITRFS